MSRFRQDLEHFFFHYGFKECINNNNINYSKIGDGEYLYWIEFKGETIDIFHAKYDKGENPCSGDPIWQKTVKLSFDPIEDNDLVASYFAS